jgi:hypothetical protein
VPTDAASQFSAEPAGVRASLADQLLRPIAALLRTGEPAATVDRLFDSQHVKDLRLIIAVAFAAVVLVGVGGALLVAENVAANEPIREWSHLLMTGAASFFTFFAPVLAAFCAVVAWTYQAGSARLGVVDLFACEISTLCRVATVMDTVRRYVGKFAHGPPAQSAGAGGAAVPAQQFTSQENYFPVFEGNTRDLQTLEARVVINITAFYTYMKAVRDSMRALAETRSQSTEVAAATDKAEAAGPWHDAARNVVYMLFLGLESARKAIHDLVEFEPEQAENTIVILISELEAYGFLRAQFGDDDMRQKRLMLRDPEYGGLVPQLCSCVEARSAQEKVVEAAMDARLRPQLSKWQPACMLLPELQKRYQAAIRAGTR